jgi:hypothetical protein
MRPLLFLFAISGRLWSWSARHRAASPQPHGGRTALAGQESEPAKGSADHARSVRETSPAKNQCRAGVVKPHLHPGVRRPEPIQPKGVRLVSGNSHAKNLWSPDVPGMSGSSGHVLRMFFKMTFPSSNPLCPASESGLNRACWRCILDNPDAEFSESQCRKRFPLSLPRKPGGPRNLQRFYQ